MGLLRTYVPATILGALTQTGWLLLANIDVLTGTPKLDPASRVATRAIDLRRVLMVMKDDEYRQAFYLPLEFR